MTNRKTWRNVNTSQLKEMKAPSLEQWQSRTTVTGEPLPNQDLSDLVFPMAIGKVPTDKESSHFIATEYFSNLLSLGFRVRVHQC